jgi:hypothetical protein
MIDDTGIFRTTISVAALASPDRGRPRRLLRPIAAATSLTSWWTQAANTTGFHATFSSILA